MCAEDDHCVTQTLLLQLNGPCVSLSPLLLLLRLPLPLLLPCLVHLLPRAGVFSFHSSMTSRNAHSPVEKNFSQLFSFAHLAHLTPHLVNLMHNQFTMRASFSLMGFQLISSYSRVTFLCDCHERRHLILPPFRRPSGPLEDSNFYSASRREEKTPKLNQMSPGEQENR